MRIIIQKFGGTSVATPELRAQAVRRIQEAQLSGYRPVVVVSAMGRAGDPYATDTLLALAKSEGASRLAPRELDLLLSCGEVIAAALLTHALLARDLPAVALTGAQAGIVTDTQYGQARILEVRPDRVRAELEAGRIPVVCGFQGVTQEGEVTTLGRGGSDTTAAVLGVALGAEVVEFFKDVDGVKTADPRLVPEAVTLHRLTYRELVEMAHLGAKVIHPRAVEIAMAGRVPLRIRPTVGDEPGTLITDGWSEAVERVDRVVAGIAHAPGRALVQVASPEDVNQGPALELFEQLAAAGISVDMIHVSPHRVAFVIDAAQAGQAERVLERLQLAHEVQPGFCKVSVVGAGMHGVPGVMARVVRALVEAGVRIFLTSDSHANISCLVKEEDARAALLALHQAFQLGLHGQTSVTGAEGVAAGRSATEPPARDGTLPPPQGNGSLHHPASVGR